MRRRALWRMGAVAAVVLASSGSAFAQAPQPKRVVLSVEDAVARAVRRSPEVASTQYDVEAFLGKKMQADSARFPQLTAIGVLGPSPAANRSPRTGESVALNSINARDGQVDNVFVRTDFLLIQPLYTFGLIDNLRAAAAHGVNAQKAAVDKTATEVALKVREAELHAHLGDLHEQLLTAADREQTLVEGGFAAEQDLFKLKTFQGELEIRSMMRSSQTTETPEDRR